jgi:hypothetical protein
VAFQPSWRNKTGTDKNTSLLRLHGGSATTSLAMQETIAMALAHSKGRHFYSLTTRLCNPWPGSSSPPIITFNAGSILRMSGVGASLG